MKLAKMAGKIGVTVAAAVAAAIMWGAGVAQADSPWGQILTGNTYYHAATFLGAPKCVALNAGDGFYNNNTRIFQWNCNGHNDQKWSTHLYGYAPSGLPLYQVINYQSLKCMEVRDAVPGNGIQVDQFTCGTGSIDSIRSQLWQISPIADGAYTLMPWSALRQGAQMCLDVWNSDGGDGVPIEQWTCNGGDNQVFLMAVG